jgi:hypothetical protein
MGTQKMADNHSARRTSQLMTSEINDKDEHTIKRIPDNRKNRIPSTISGNIANGPHHRKIICVNGVALLDTNKP